MNHDTAHTFFPERRNSVPSTATSTSASAATNSEAVSPARHTPRCSGDQQAAEKNRCADHSPHTRDNPPPRPTRRRSCATPGLGHQPGHQGAESTERRRGETRLKAANKAASDAGRFAFESIGGLHDRGQQHHGYSPYLINPMIVGVSWPCTRHHAGLPTQHRRPPRGASNYKQPTNLTSRSRKLRKLSWKREAVKSAARSTHAKTLKLQSWPMSR